MLYVDFEAGNKAYKLRINTRNTVQLEKSLGCNPLAIFGMGNEDRVPTITEMVAVLFNALQAYHHGITLADTYDIFDSYLADGHSSTDFISVIIKIYKVSGYMKDDKAPIELEDDTEVEGKNE